MTKIGMLLSPAAEAHMKKRIAEQVGAKARKIMTRLHENILERTPYNTGRTLGSWFGSAGSPVLMDVADRFPKINFAYSTDLPHTNQLEVGAEEGRSFYERFSLKSTQSINFEQKPYRKFYIANGADLDSGYGLNEPLGQFKGLTSSLPQGPGSRAAVQEYGMIASFDLFASTGDVKIFNFNPRGTNAFGLAIANIRVTARYL